MSTTNSYDFVVTRDNLITDAHLHISAIGEGESPTANQVTEAARILNMLVKLRAADGMPLWALKRGTILPNSDVSSMSTVSHIVHTYDSTTLSADAASGATAITITAAGSIADSDQIGVEQDDGTMKWTTVSAGGGTTSLTLAAALTDDAASGNRVYAYTASADRIGRPLRVIDANVKEISGSTQWPVQIISQSEYYSYGNLTSEGIPNSLYYEAGLGSNTADPATAAAWYGTFYFYPRFSSGDHIIEFTYHRPFQDFDAAGDHPDFPQEFYLPLMLELAALLGPKFGVPLEERRRLFSEANAYKEEALSTIYPEGSLRILPRMDY